jgi:hypothetical protein
MQYCGEPMFREALVRHGYRRPRELPTGAIVAVAELVTIRHTGFDEVVVGWVADLSKQERTFGDYSMRRCGWFLKNIKRLPVPVPCKGALSLWALPDDVRSAIERQV